jgi:hypothetical protein
MAWLNNMDYPNIGNGTQIARMPLKVQDGGRSCQLS